MEYLKMFDPGNYGMYLTGLFVGLLAHYALAKAYGRTAAPNIWAYWVSETPSMSIATMISLGISTFAVFKSGMLSSMAGADVFQSAFGVAFVLDASIQMPATALVPAGAAASPLAAEVLAATPPKPAAGFVRLELLLVMLVLLLAGCGALGLATPKTPTQDLAYAVGIHDGLAKSLANAVTTGAISPSDGQKVESYLAQGAVGLKAARVSLDGCTVSGQPVATVQAVVPGSPAVTSSLPGIAVLAVQAVACNPKTTALDQLVLVNGLLQQLSAYYASKGVKAGP